MPFARNPPPRLAPYRPLLWLACAAGLGIAADWWLDQAGYTFSALAWCVAGCLAVVASHWAERRGRELLATAGLLAAVACLGASWHHFHWCLHESNHLGRYAKESPQPVCVEAIALERTKWRPASTSNPLRALPSSPSSELLVDVQRLREGSRWRRVSGVCRLRVAGELLQVNAGDRLHIFAQLGKQPPVMNPGQYDWAAAERGAGRLCELYAKATPCVQVLDRSRPTNPRLWITRASERAEMRLAHYVGPRQSNLALALLLGLRERLDRSVVQAFMETGTIHLLVVSGLHVGMMACVIWMIAGNGFLPRKVALLITIGAVVAYAAIAGGRPPVIRAAVLVLMMLFGVGLGRGFSTSNLLGAAALVIMALNPSELFRSGTQLSFLSVAVLVGYGHALGRRKPPDPLKKLLRDSESWACKAARISTSHWGHLTAASLVVWLLAAPLVAYHFNIITPVGVVLTPMLWLFVTTALISGMLICLIGWCFPPIAYVLGKLCGGALSTASWLVHSAEQTSAAGWYTAGPGTWWVLGFYGGLAAIAVFPALRAHWRWSLSLAALWMATGFGTSAASKTNDQLRCTFLAMGHGTCVVVELPGNQTLLYDAGSLGSPEMGTQTVSGFLWSRGISRIDALVISHADVDHYNAVPGLVERFDVQTVYVSPMMFDPWATGGQLHAPNYLRRHLETAGVSLQEIWMNDRLEVADSRVAIEILHPPRSGVPGRDNANSLLLCIEFLDQRLLLPGDLESPGIEAVMAEVPLDVDILLAPHHGSSNSDPPGFAAWCTPEWTVVSGDWHPGHHHTAASYRQVGSKVLHTADCGAVSFTMGKTQLFPKIFRD